MYFRTCLAAKFSRHSLTFSPEKTRLFGFLPLNFLYNRGLLGDFVSYNVQYCLLIKISYESRHFMIV